MARICTTGSTRKMLEQVEEGCLLFRRLLGDDGLFLVGTKDVFVKEIVPGDLL